MAKNSDPSTYANIMKHPVLYDSAFDDDSTQGLVTLSDASTCQIVFNWNSFPTLSMTYPRDGVGAKLLDYDMVIMTDISWKWVHQKFRISQMQRDGDDYIITANHVAADLAYKPTTKEISMANANSTDVFNQMINTLAGDDHEFYFQSDVSKVSNVDIPAGVAGNILTDPDQEGDQATNSIIGLFGGELEFDNRNIYHSQQAGRSTGIVIQYGKNLQTISDDTNLDGTYTAIYPIATYTPGQAVATATNVNWSNFDTTYLNKGTALTYQAGGTIQIYDSPLSGHKSIGTLSSGQKIVLGTAIKDGDLIKDINGNDVQVNTMNGDDWYPIQGGGWIDSAWVSFDKSGDYLINNATGHVTVAGKGTDKDAWSNRWQEHGYFIVTCDGNGTHHGIRVFYDPNPGDEHYPTGKYLKYKKTYSYNMVTVNSKGDTWYRIGDHEWVYGPHVTVTQGGANIQIPTKGSGYVKKNAQAYKWDSKKKTLVAQTHVELQGKKGKKTMKPKKVKTYVPKGNKKISKTMQLNGSTYYKVGSYWVKSGYVDFSKIGASKPVSPSKWISGSASSTGSDDYPYASKIEMYDDPAHLDDLNWSIPSGTSLDVTATAQGADGQNMYEVTYKGKTGWIRADMTNTKGDADIEPQAADNTYDSDSDGDEVVDANIPEDKKQVTVEIGTLYADSTFSQENARIERVDLSSYFTHDDQDLSGQQADGTFKQTTADEEQLRTIALNYMKEHNIGHPSTSLTVDYQQLTGLAGDATRLNLYDYVVVDYEKMGISTPAEVTSTTWDALAHHYVQITVGDLPKSWQHLLLQAADKNTNERVSKSTVAAKGREQTLIDQYKSMMSLEGSDRKRAEQKLMDQLGLVQTNTDKWGNKVTVLETSKTDFENRLQQFSEQMSSMKSFIEDVDESNTIYAYPNWQAPQMLVANTSNNGKMEFSANGIIWYDRSGGTGRTAITADGHLAAESIDAGTINAVSINSCTINSSLHTGSDGHMQIWIGMQNPTPYGTNYGVGLGPKNGGNAIWVTSPQYYSMMSSGQFAVQDHTTNVINPSTTRVKPDVISVISDDNHVLTQQNFYDHAYNKIKSWVQGWVADYINGTGQGHPIWKGVDPDYSGNNSTNRFLP